jgi:hypothetical protein
MGGSEFTKCHTGARRSIQGHMKRGSFVLLLIAILAGSAGTARSDIQTPTLTNDTIVLIPDTQYYSKYDPAKFSAQTSWIASQNPAFVKMVMHLGDITDNNTDDEIADIQWNNAQAAMNLLRDANLPFVMVPGNHDNPDNGKQRNTARYNENFPASGFEELFEAQQTQGVVWVSLDGTSDNSYATFTAAGRQFMVVNLEFAPRKQNLCRANQAINNHFNRAVILVTHCYQGAAGGFANCTTPYNLIGSNGDTIWHELVKRHNNVQMIVSGHVTSSALKRRNLVSDLQTSIDLHVPGGEVVEILTDFQEVPFLPDTLQGAFFAGQDHGMGWMRSLSFIGSDPTEDQIRLQTFSVMDQADALAAVDAYLANEENEGKFPEGIHQDHTFFVPKTFPTLNTGDLLTVHDFIVNESSTGDQLRPRIAGDGFGDKTVVWEDTPSEILFPWLRSYDIKSRRFGIDGCERRLQETVNGATGGQQRHPAVAIGEDGSKTVVWEDDSDGNGSYQILASSWEPNGSPRFLDMTVNQDSTGQQLRPDVAVDRSGRIYVVWQDNKGGNYDIMAARFSPTGVRIGPNDFRVNAGVAGDQLVPRIAIRRDQFSPQDGSVVIVWEDDFEPPHGVFQIKAVRYLAAGILSSVPFKETWPGLPGVTDRTINQFSDGQQQQPAIAMHKNSGQFVIVWQDDRNVNDFFQVKMAGFNADGSKKLWGPVVNGVQEEDKTVNQLPGGDQTRPQISMNNLGHFAVVWEDDLNDNKVFQIKVAGFNVTDGARITPIGNDQTVNFSSNGDQLRPSVLLGHDHDQVTVVWQDDLNGNGLGEIVGKSFVLGQPVDAPGNPVPEIVEDSPPPFAIMDGAPWFAIVGSIGVDGRRTAGVASISFAPGFTEARPPGFNTGVWPAIGSKLLVDVFVPAQQPASGWKGVVQLYWGVPDANLNHQPVGQKELSPLAGDRWHTLEFDLPEVMRRLFLESHKNAELTFAVNTDPGAPARTLLDNLRFGGALIPHAQAECDTPACLAACGPGKASCDGDTSNGCETYLGNHRRHCGACGHSCGLGLCVNAACEPGGARDISASINFTSQSPTEYCAALTFTNNALVPVAWEVILDLQTSTITSSWNGTFTGSQGVVGVSGVGWNNQIQPGASLNSLGFCAQRPANSSLATVVQTNTQFQ